MSVVDVAPERPLPAATPELDPRGSVPAGGLVPSGTSWREVAAVFLAAGAVLAVWAPARVVSGDGVWHLVWGRSLVEGTLDSFLTGPTPHPLLLGMGAASSLLGDHASYFVTSLVFGPVAFGALAAAVYEVARRLSSRWAGAVAVMVLLTSAGVLSLVGAARYDVAFAGLVMTAVALDMARPRRGTATLACLAAAGLIRPEAWVLACLYLLWLTPRLGWRGRLRLGALAASAPLIWAGMDLFVTGDPLWSLHVTDDYSDDLYRQYTPSENLVAAGRNLVWYLGVVPLVLLVPATAFLVRDRSRVALPAVSTLLVTVGVFGCLVAVGMASSERYLLVPVCLLAALAAAGLDGMGRRTPRRVVLGAVLAVLIGLQFTAKLDVHEAVAAKSAQARERERTAWALVELRGVAAALRNCPSVSLPTGKMRHLFAFPSGRPPEAFTSDPTGTTQPDVFVAPGDPEVARSVLTRFRFDDDPSFRVPPGMRPGPRNADWATYLSPSSECTLGLR